jgi:hypothetical protein
VIYAFNWQRSGINERTIQQWINLEEDKDSVKKEYQNRKKKAKNMEERSENETLSHTRGVKEAV